MDYRNYFKFDLHIKVNMAKKSQVSIFIIMGLMIILVTGFFVFRNRQMTKIQYTSKIEETFSFSNIRVDASSYINLCIKESVVKAIEEKGVLLDEIAEYESLVSSKISECSEGLFAQLEKKGYEIVKGDIDIEFEIGSHTIYVGIFYPITIQNQNQKVIFEDFHYTFDRISRVKIPGGYAESDIKIFSTDQKAELIILQGTIITDEEGNPIEEIGLRIEDLHFDNLNNGAVVGKIIYEGTPDGAQFSQPVEISIEFRNEDIPEGYTEKNLYVSWWGDDFPIWWGLPTTIENNRAKAQLSHFTKISITYANQKSFTPSEYHDWLFYQRYSYCPEGSEFSYGCECGEEYWDYGIGIALRSNKDEIFFTDIRELERIFDSDDYISYISYGFNEDYNNCDEEKLCTKEGYLDEYGNACIGGNTWTQEGRCIYEEGIEQTLQDSLVMISANLDLSICQNESFGAHVYGCGICNPISPLINDYEGYCDCYDPLIIPSSGNHYFGWRDYRCIGGKIESPDTGYAMAVVLEGMGDSAMAEGFPIVYSRGNSAECKLIPYKDGKKIHQFTYFDSENNKHPAFGIKGMIAINNDGDPCAQCGVAWRYVGSEYKDILSSRGSGVVDYFTSHFSE
jgi:hypothetical protein